MEKYLSLKIPQDNIIATYVWVVGESIRCKDRTINSLNYDCAAEVPEWTFDGYATHIAKIDESDILLKPIRTYKNPFKRSPHIIVLCETYDYYTNEPTSSNKRFTCEEVCDKTNSYEPLFGFEQEYYLINERNDEDYSISAHYCGIGLLNRSLVDAHYFCCLYAGIKFGGTNAECGFNQWEFQIGPCDGLKLCDDLWIARFILLQLAEERGLSVSFKVIPETNSKTEPTSGGHMNFSTLLMRQSQGIKEIHSAIGKLSLAHEEGIQFYDPSGGKDNKQRLNGKGETSQIATFTSGVGDRRGSVRIPIKVQIDGRGYFEDRRPASNCDPYSVVESMLNTILLN